VLSLGIEALLLLCAVIGSSLGPSESWLTVQSERRTNTSKRIDSELFLHLAPHTEGLWSELKESETNVDAPRAEARGVGH